MPQGQEKLGKTKKNDKIQEKIGNFEKSQERKFKKHWNISVQIYEIAYTKKTFEKVEKLIKIQSNKSCKIFLYLTNLLYFQCLKMVKPIKYPL